MMQECFLIWIDILGFDSLPREIHEEKGVEERKVRADFIKILQEKVDSIEAKGLILGKNYGEKDDWLLVADSMNAVFRVISEILEHNTGYEGHERIPLEIGVGVGDYDRWARFVGTELVVENSTIDVLKTKIIGYYHKWYERNNKRKIKSTFVVLTESAFDRLEPLDKEMCSRIECKHGGKKKGAPVFFHASVAGIQWRGRVFDFLERIEHSGSKWYDRIDRVFVPPVKYKDIIKTLEEDQIVFIVGTPEYGKTYTAVRLLWEYFCKGYEPIWAKGGELSQRMRARERLEEIENELRPPCVMYFEDPFGSSAYEGRSGLEREIGTIIDYIQTAKNVKVVVTSREEVFKQFKKEHSSFVELEKFEKKLNMKSHSYDHQKRRKILTSWAKAKGCKWLQDDMLRKAVEKSVNEGMLATPLSIRDFVASTINVTKIDELRKKLEEKSIESSRSFAKEIAGMSDDKVLFLSFPLIADYPVDLVALGYVKAVKELDIKDSWDFEEVLNWFEDDKVTVSEGKVGFSHSSYVEAMNYLLFEKGRPHRIKDIFSRLLLCLGESDSRFARCIPRVIAENFDSLPRNVGDLLRKLAENDLVTWSVARAVAENFCKLPEDIRNLLAELAKKDSGAAECVAQHVARNFDNIPRRIRNELLFSLTKRRETRVVGKMLWVIAENFRKLPRYITDRFVVLAKREDMAENTAKAVARYFNELPENVRDLLGELATKDSRIAKNVAFAVAAHFNSLPENVRSLLVVLAKRSDTAGSVAHAVAKYFGRLPEDIRNLLVELAKEDSAIAGCVTLAVSQNFMRIPEDYRDRINHSLNPVYNRFIDSKGRIRSRALYQRD
jgi:hypothetical protein